MPLYPPTSSGTRETVALTDETTNASINTTVMTWRAPTSGTLALPVFYVNTAPTGSTCTVDINKNGSTILSTKLTIDAGELTSATAATPAVVSDSTVTAGDVYTFDIDQIGSTIAGKGYKVIMAIT